MALRTRLFADSNAVRSSPILLVTACEATVVAITLGDLVLPDNMDLLAFTAIPVLVGARRLAGRTVAMLALSAAIAQIAATIVEGGPAWPLLIGLVVLSAVGIFGRPLRLRKDRAESEPAPERISGSPTESALTRLSPREREIVLLTLEGLTAPRIGARLFISKRTVETHLANAYQKLGVTSKLELVSRRSQLTEGTARRLG